MNERQFELLMEKLDVIRCGIIDVETEAQGIKELAQQHLTKAKAAGALPEGEICSWCLDAADVEIKVENGHRFCCRCGRKLPLA